MHHPRVFTIPAGAPFLSTLADGLLSGELAGAAAMGRDLAAATVYLPTARACRALAVTLASRAGGRGLLLPRIVPLGEIDEAADAAPAEPEDAVGPLERRLLLAGLIQDWGAGESGILPQRPAEALALAGELESLMDSIGHEGIDWASIEQAVETDFSRYFALTLGFLRIAQERWPALLLGRGATDPARRRHEATLAEAARIAAGPDGPVVAAGSTGSVPATAKLLAAIARSPAGAVVLPGLDTDLDAAGWEALGGHLAGGAPAPGADDVDGPVWSHPQFMLRRLLVGQLGLSREDVATLAPPHERSGARAQRRRMISQVMRPAATTDAWAAIPPLDLRAMKDAGTDGLAVIEASDEREEALAIAVAIRETLEDPGRRAALVTPDRMLARRVTAELERWRIAVEDSAGLALAETPAGRLASLAAEAAAFDFHPVQLLALLAHPDVTLGLARGEVERARTALEVGALRGPAPRPGLAGIAAAIDLRRAKRGRRDPLPRQALSERDWDRAAALVERLRAAFAGFAAHERPVGFVELLAGHESVVRDLVEPADGGEPPDGPSWAALAALFEEAASLSRASGPALRGGRRDYPALFATLARDRVLRPPAGPGSRRVAILGLLEARLLEVDRVVLAGLDEGLWPPTAEGDAFLNRPLREKLGLAPPERRIGQTAHDFVQAIATPDAVVTRARKREGNPTVPSRFLERLQAFVGPEAWARLRAAGDRFRDLAAAIERPRALPPLRRPAPRPGPARFPRRLSVTEIETLVRDPYAILARHVLRLTPLDPLATPPSPAERGTLVHDVLSEFTAAHPGPLPPRAAEILIQRGLDAFAAIADAYPEIHALWWPAFERMVPAYLAWEAERRDGLVRLAVELPGRMEVGLADQDVLVVSGRADRIEVDGDGRATIVDFKTGSVPETGAIADGFSPQMTLEAAMLAAGGFAGQPPHDGATSLLHVKLGGRDVLTPVPFAPKGDRPVAAIAADHVAGLARLARHYAVDGGGYLSRAYPAKTRRVSPYDHLARVREWSAVGDDEPEPT